MAKALQTAAKKHVRWNIITIYQNVKIIKQGIIVLKISWTNEIFTFFPPPPFVLEMPLVALAKIYWALCNDDGERDVAGKGKNLLFALGTGEVSSIEFSSFFLLLLHNISLYGVSCCLSRRWGRGWEKWKKLRMELSEKSENFKLRSSGERCTVEKFLRCCFLSISVQFSRHRRWKKVVHRKLRKRVNLKAHLGNELIYSWNLSCKSWQFLNLKLNSYYMPQWLKSTWKFSDFNFRLSKTFRWSSLTN